MTISYLAKLPDPSSLCMKLWPEAGWQDADGAMRDVGKPVPHLAGRWSNRGRKITYAAGIGPVPHIEFANSPTDDQSIRRFTERWGPLFTLPFVPPRMRRSGIEFAMNIAAWRRCHERMSAALKLVASRRVSDRQKLPGLFGLASSAEFKFGELRPAVECDSRGDSRGAFGPKLVAASLWDAMLTALWLDLSARGLRMLRCLNPTCRRFFTTERPNQKYCDALCAARVAKRKWWRKKGAQRRASSRAQAK